MATIDLKALLGAAIKAERSALRISQEELAYRADLHRTYVSDVERGARNPSIESVAKLAHALELPVATLFERATGNETKQMVEILLVEDNPRDEQLTLRELAKARITNPLHVVRDGAEALDFVFATGSYADRAETQRPQIILLNLSLPKKSGLEVLLEIKADKRTQKIPIIVLTASNRARDINECRRLGVVTYIVKPVRFQNFREAAHHFQFDWALLKPSRVSVGYQGFRRR
jgi:two-component system, response regulator